MKRRLSITLKFAASAGILFWVYRSASLQIALMDIASVQLSFLAVFFAIALTNSLLSSLKWWWALTRDGVSISLRELFVSYMIGGFLNLFLPSNIGGDGYRIASVGKGRMLKSAASVVADRLSGLLALTLIGTGFASLSVRHYAYPIAAWLPALLLAALIGLTVALFYPALTRWGLRITRLDRLAPIRTLSDSLLGSFSTYRQNPGLLAGMLGISLLFQFLYIVAIYVLARALHIDSVHFQHFCVFVPLVAILEAIPISVYGAGLRDLGYLFFFTEVGLAGAREHAMALSVLYVGSTILYVMMGGIFLLVRISRGTIAGGRPDC
jgi:uncharacterized membrane protein YbhN (UPF0104 family)